MRHRKVKQLASGTHNPNYSALALLLEPLGSTLWLPLAFLSPPAFLFLFLSGTGSVTQGFGGRQTEIAIPASLPTD